MYRYTAVCVTIYQSVRALTVRRTIIFNQLKVWCQWSVLRVAVKDATTLKCRVVKQSKSHCYIYARYTAVVSDWHTSWVCAVLSGSKCSYWYWILLPVPFVDDLFLVIATSQWPWRYKVHLYFPSSLIETFCWIGRVFVFPALRALSHLSMRQQHPSPVITSFHFILTVNTMFSYVIAWFTRSYSCS